MLALNPCLLLQSFNQVQKIGKRVLKETVRARVRVAPQGDSDGDLITPIQPSTISIDPRVIRSSQICLYTHIVNILPFITQMFIPLISA